MSRHSGSPRAPVVGVGAVVLKQGRVLLVQRGQAPLKGAWSLPGGKQKFGETVREAVLREVEEEAGIQVKIDSLLDVVDARFPEREDGDPAHHYTLVDFLAHWVSGELVAGDDAVAARWFAPDELDTLSLWSETRRIIDLGLKLTRKCR